MHRRPSARRAAVAVVACLVPALVACQGDADEPVDPTTDAPSSSSPAAAGPITVGVYGRNGELNAFESIVTRYNATSTTGQVELETWADHAAAVEGVEDGDPPDVFMMSRRDLPGLLEREAVRPVGELLDERGVDFGDGYSRDAVQAFGVDAQLQCMAYSVSPMVMYVNTDLVDFAKMERRGIDVPGGETWSLEQFTAAAEFASRPARGTRGFHVEPTLSGLAPFIYSGGGRVFDSDEDPASLAFSDGDTRDALERSLPVLRDAQLQLTEEQLARATPQQWFERGRLGMIAGYRDLVPRLRSIPSLSFDVMSMPVLDSAATAGDITGLCMSADAADPQGAADVIAHLISDDAVAAVTAAGFMVPANNAVASSEQFLQPLREPKHSRLFNLAIRGLVVPPLVESPSQLEEATAPLVQDLLTDPGEIDLELLTEQIDEVSRPILDPDYVPEESSDPSETGSPSE